MNQELRRLQLGWQQKEIKKQVLDSKTLARVKTSLMQQLLEKAADAPPSELITYRLDSPLDVVFTREDLVSILSEGFGCPKTYPLLSLFRIGLNTQGRKCVQIPANDFRIFVNALLDSERLTSEQTFQPMEEDKPEPLPKPLSVGPPAPKQRRLRSVGSASVASEHISITGSDTGSVADSTYESKTVFRDLVRKFHRECVAYTPDAQKEYSLSELYAAFCTWCVQKKIMPEFNIERFGIDFRNGLSPGHLEGNRCFRGFKLRGIGWHISL